MMPAAFSLPANGYVTKSRDIAPPPLKRSVPAESTTGGTFFRRSGFSGTGASIASALGTSSVPLATAMPPAYAVCAPAAMVRTPPPEAVAFAIRLPFSVPDAVKFVSAPP